MEELLLANPFLNWLLGATWKASVLILLVLVVQKLFRRYLSPRWQYALWLLVLLRLIFPFSYATQFSIFNYLSPRLHNVPAQVATKFDGPATPLASGAAVTPAPGSIPNPAVTATSALPLPAMVQARDYSLLETFLLGLPDFSPAARCLLFSVLVVWPLGVALYLLQILRQNLGFFRRLRNARIVTEPAVLQLFEDCQDVLGLQMNIPVLEMDELKSPGLFGFIRPRLLLPSGLVTAFSERELRHIFLHELAHVKRHDPGVNWLMTVLQILHWFNPIIWLGFARMRADRELACDALLLSRSRKGEGVSYGETIIKMLEKFVTPAPVSGLLGLLEDPQEMKRRITMISIFKKTARGSLITVTMLLLLGLAVLTDAKPPLEVSKMPAGIVGWWRGDGDGHDLVGGHPAIFSGPVTFAPSRMGTAFELDGTNSVLTIASAPDLNVGAGAGFTIDAWVNYRNPVVISPILAWNVGGAGVRLFIEDSTLAASLPAAGTNDSTISLASREGLLMPNVFNHIALTYSRDSGIATLYVNGAVEAFSNGGRLQRLTTGDISIGWHVFKKVSHFDGCLDEIQLFDRPLSSGEVMTLYRAGLDHTMASLAKQ